MADDLADLLTAARLIRDRDLAALARATAAWETAKQEEAQVAAEIEAGHTALRADPNLEAIRPGAFARWLRHVRRQEARVAAKRVTLSRDEAALRATAARSFGRVLALEALERRD